MRLNKVSELIHKSTNYQNLDSASVSVHFQEIVDLVISKVFLIRVFFAISQWFRAIVMLDYASSLFNMAF